MSFCTDCIPAAKRNHMDPNAKHSSKQGRLGWEHLRVFSLCEWTETLPNICLTFYSQTRRRNYLTISECTGILRPCLCSSIGMLWTASYHVCPWKIWLTELCLPRVCLFTIFHQNHSLHPGLLTFWENRPSMLRYSTVLFHPKTRTVYFEELKTNSTDKCKIFMS